MRIRRCQMMRAVLFRSVNDQLRYGDNAGPVIFHPRLSEFSAYPNSSRYI